MSTKTGKKITGGKYISRRKKKSYEIKGHFRIIKVGELKRKSKRTRGGNQKNFVLSINEINVRTNKGTQKTKVKNVIETPSNRFLARQDILTKGTILDTDLGKVKVTNRPSQDGILNGILVE